MFGTTFAQLSTVPRLLCLVSAVTLLIAPTVAVANVNQNVTVRSSAVPQHDAPATILSCLSNADDFNKYQTYAYTQIHTEVSFAVSSTSPQPATVVRFGFEIDDSFNHTYGTFFGTTQGSFAPGVTIKPHRAGLANVLQTDATTWNSNVSGQDIGAVWCYISDVKFADGSEWHANLIDELRNAGTTNAEP